MLRRLAFMLLVTFSVSTYAYFDPGIGSMVGQFFIAMVATMSVYWRRLTTYIRALISKLKKQPAADMSDKNLKEKKLDTEK